MRSSVVLSIVVVALSLVTAAPTGVRSALEARQSNNSGSTSTSTSNNNGLVNLGSSGAAAAEDGQSTSSTSSTSCSKPFELCVRFNPLLTSFPADIVGCSGGSSAAGPTDSSSSSSSSTLGDGLGEVVDDVIPATR